MTNVQRLRDRLPLAVFVLVLIFAVIVLASACLCATNHPGQAIERALAAVASLPALVEVWSLVAIAAVSVTFAITRPRLQQERASPALLQCFLF